MVSLHLSIHLKLLDFDLFWRGGGNLLLTLMCIRPKCFLSMCAVGILSQTYTNIYSILVSIFVCYMKPVIFIGWFANAVTQLSHNRNSSTRWLRCNYRIESPILCSELFHWPYNNPVSRFEFKFHSDVGCVCLHCCITSPPRTISNDTFNKKPHIKQSVIGPFHLKISRWYTTLY